MEQTSQPKAIAAKAVLSERQVQALALVARGFTSKEIARKLLISPSTVDNHIRAAVDKLGARNRHEAARQIEDRYPADTLARPAVVEVSRPGLPPLGGSTNSCSLGQRLMQIVLIAVLSAIAICGAILTIVGVVHVLS